MAIMMTSVKVADYEAWKKMFDSGRESVRAQAKGHRIWKSAEDPNELFIQVEFASPQDARAAREKLFASGALDRVTVKSGPTLTEVVETVSY